MRNEQTTLKENAYERTLGSFDCNICGYHSPLCCRRHALRLGRNREDAAEILVLSSTYSRTNFSLVSLLPKINKGLEQARFPHDFSRQARPYCKKWKGSDEKFSMQLSYFLFFTAIEYKNFLLYLYIPVVRELQQNEYQTHTTKLVRALKVLWSRSITNEELDLAERLINEFLADLEKLYGKQAMTYNAHLLAHTFQTRQSAALGLFGLWLVSDLGISTSM